MTKTVNKEPISVARESGPGGGGFHSDNPPSPHPHTNAQFDSAMLKEKKLKNLLQLRAGG